MNTKTIFAWVLSGIVVIIAIMCLLGIWDVVRWEDLQHYLGRTIGSLLVIVISGVVLYIIHALFGIQQDRIKQRQEDRTV